MPTARQAYLGYIGASNDTSTANEILRVLKDNLLSTSAVGAGGAMEGFDLSVVSRMSNKVGQ